MIIRKIVFLLGLCACIHIGFCANKAETAQEGAEKTAAQQTTGSLDLFLDSAGHTIFTVRIRLENSGTHLTRLFDGTFADGTTFHITDLEPGTYRLFCSNVTGIWTGLHTSLLKGVCSPQSVTVTAGNTASTMLEISE